MREQTLRRLVVTDESKRRRFPCSFDPPIIARSSDRSDSRASSWAAGIATPRRHGLCIGYDVVVRIKQIPQGQLMVVSSYARMVWVELHNAISRRSHRWI